ncbi:hypothetical protein H1164_03585 [Thermoactinomyces daqus]|uniref:Uncharacterized protein n=1 Tax=Thermoactinomyces daqus TaxID=1329516 RepID=A0A7W1X8F1_9BACL|nr:hypothetical protein [Thermoactinomyces daqus]MBA4541985.1 hypothetical protein [Thermoactinomyces daqus]
MATEYFPFDEGQGSNVTETQWAKMARFWRMSGVLPDNIDAIFDSFVSRPSDYNDIQGELTVTGNSSTLSVDVSPGKAWIHGHFFSSDATINKVIAQNTNANGYNRIDRVVLRLDWTQNTITVEVLQGTAAASPTPPVLTQIEASRWEIPLAQVLVPTTATTGANLTITDERIPSLPQDMIVACKLYQAADPGQIINNATYTTVNFDSAHATFPGMADMTNDRIIIPMDGIYLINFNYRISASSGIGAIAYSAAGGSQTITNSAILARANNVEASLTAIKSFSKGDFVWASYYQSTGGAVNAFWWGPNSPSLTLFRLGDKWQ